MFFFVFFFLRSRRGRWRWGRDWRSGVCSPGRGGGGGGGGRGGGGGGGRGRSGSARNGCSATWRGSRIARRATSSRRSTPISPASRAARPLPTTARWSSSRCEHASGQAEIGRAHV